MVLIWATFLLITVLTGCQGCDRVFPYAVCQHVADPNAGCSSGGSPIRECRDGCTVFHCPSNTGYLNNWSQTHSTCGCTGRANCSEAFCNNVGSCFDEKEHGEWKLHCKCRTGYIGLHCDRRGVDHCRGNPCGDFGKCTNFPNTYNCTCHPTHYGTNCTRHMCTPAQADIIFVLDSSSSMTEAMFNKQLDFISKFVDRVPIGPSDLLVSVITFSFKAKVEFWPSSHTSNTSLKAALKNISFRPGATFTHEGLSKVRSVIEDRPTGGLLRYVVLITDGMSTYRQKTLDEAKRLKNLSSIRKVISIGVGSQVSHQELVGVATNASYVFSVQNFDALYTIVKQLVLETCNETRKSSLSDVVLLLDSSSAGDFEGNRDALSEFLDSLELQDPSETRFSVASFDSHVKPLFSFGNGGLSTGATNRQADLAKLSATADIPSNITAALQYAQAKIFAKPNASRNGSRKFIVVFSNGNFVPINNGTIKAVVGNKVTVFAVGHGQEVNIENLIMILNDPYNLFMSKGAVERKFELIRAFFTYITTV